MNGVSISVVVPTYHRTSLLSNCLQKLVDQSFDKQMYEVIIVSDGPDNKTKEVADRYEVMSKCNIRFLNLPVKKGPAAARNMGWQHAKGVLVAFTDDDCLPDKEWLASIWRHYSQQEELAFAGKVIVPVSENPTDFELNTKGLETGDFVTANCVVTKSTLEVLGGFDKAFTSAWREDSDLEFKLLTKGVPITKLADAKVIHPVRKVPWGISIKEQKKTMFNALLYKKYPVLYRQRIKSKPNWTYYNIVASFLIFVFAIVFKISSLSLLAFFSWLLLTGAFIAKRLAATRKTREHVIEMILTSVVIPFLSIYWTIYGAVKYRVLFF